MRTFSCIVLGQAVIRLHCASLLGMSKENNKGFPRPATVGERRQWLHEIESEDKNKDAPGESDVDGNYQSETKKWKEGGQTKVIMDCMLRKHGVRRFAPDFGHGMNSDENKFLWELALKILVKLVQCGEYVGVSLDETPEPIIASQPRKHVKDCLTKRFVGLILSKLLLCVFGNVQEHGVRCLTKL